MLTLPAKAGVIMVAFRKDRFKVVICFRSPAFWAGQVLTTFDIYQLMNGE
jgi:hypothetical protein